MKVNKAIPHELDSFLDDHQRRNRKSYFKQLRDKFGDVPSCTPDVVGNKHPVLIETELEYDDLLTSIDVLLKADSGQRKRRVVYVPVLVGGTYLVTQDQKIALTFVGIVLSLIQRSPCTAGKVLSSDRKVHSVKFEKQERQVQGIIRVLRAWIQDATHLPPDIFLNKHCPLCPFRKYCRSEALQIDHLSLLSGLSQKQIRNYNKKGIFTVTQLAYTYRARRQKNKESTNLPNTSTH